MNKWGKLLISILGCELAGILGSVVTAPAISTWYITLNKSPLNPPPWIFGPVWTVLYLLMGVSLFLLWKKGFTNKKRKKALTIFFIQLSLNVAWSFLFFGLHSPIFGLLDIVLLWVAILATILAFMKISKIAAYLLLPYFAWVSFATILNASVVILN